MFSRPTEKTHIQKITTAVSLLPVLTAVLLLASCQQDSADKAIAQQASISQAPKTVAEFINEAKGVMGALAVTRIAYQGNGWEACLGQPWHIDDGWARWRITDYKRVTDFATFNSLQTARRQSGMDPEKLGGCGAQPDANAQNQQSSVNDTSSWEQSFQITLTPLGFLDLAQKSKAEDVQLLDTESDVVLAIKAERNGIQYQLTGHFGNDALLDHIETWIDNTVYGDMQFEAEFSAYQAFAGLQFPGRIIQKQGGLTTLDLTITDVVPNTEDSAVPEPRDGGRFGGGAQADLPEYEEIGEGIYALHGGYQSVVMEFADFSVVLDGLQNDARADDIIRITQEIIPDKPIAYVFSTHNHFDHASGLRQFLAQGTTIITHEINAEFFQTALSTPRTLNPGYSDANDNDNIKVLGVTDFFAIDDGEQRVEFHKLNNSKHADDMLIAYIPSIKTVVEADVLQPWINPVFGGGEHPFLIHLADELDRLALDYQQFVPVHRPSTPPLMTKAELMEVLGRD